MSESKSKEPIIVVRQIKRRNGWSVHPWRGKGSEGESERKSGSEEADRQKKKAGIRLARPPSSIRLSSQVPTAF